MRKKLLSIFILSAMSAALVACGGAKEGTTEEATYEVEELATIATTAAPTEEATIEAYGEGNILKNGDFSEPTNRWGSYKMGGNADMAINENEELQIDIHDPGTVGHGVQVYYDGFVIREGGVYEVSFDAYSTIDRPFEWRIQVNGGDYHAYVNGVVDCTSEVQHITKQFTMEEATDPSPRMCFNMGLLDVLQEEGVKTLPEHSILIDNVTLRVIDSANMVKDPEKVPVPLVKANQLGYVPNASKVAVCSNLDEADNKFMIIDQETGKTVFTGDLTEPSPYTETREKVCQGDFSAFKKPGKYIFKTIGCAESYPFEISDTVYDSTFKDVFRMLYLQRCGMELTSDLAGDFAHKVCHTSEATIWGTDKKIDASGGWHDAGDYGRYTVSGAKTVADLLLAYEMNPTVFTDDMDIPESGNGVPDVLDEARYELEWLFKVQDPETGGVYHKVTCAAFPETVMPEYETAELFVMPVSNTATGDFVAVMAMAARVYQDVDKAFADKCLEAAKKSYTYVKNTPHNTGFVNPKEIDTGEYPDIYDQDEKFWAAAEMYKTTKDAAYQEDVKTFITDTKFTDFGWQTMGGYASYAYLSSENLDSATEQTVKENFFAWADELVAASEKNGYKEAKTMQGYVWGSNMGMANSGMCMVLANKLSPNEEYIKCAYAQLDYLLGVNGCGYCFVTGAGTMYPKDPHHRPSQAVGKCIPGMLVGGPNSGLNDSYASAVFQDTPRGLCYADTNQSYSMNEVTVYWNSPLIYLMSALK